MTTCLEDIKMSLDALVAALNGGLGGEPISISLDSQASAQASSQSWALSTAQAQAIAASSALALSIVNIDLEIAINQTTTITNLLLPAVSKTTPPNLTVFPEAETGVSDTPRPNEGSGGSLCQTVYFVIDSIQAFVTLLSKFPEIGLFSSNVLSFVVLPALQSLEFFLATKGIIIPRTSLIAIQAFLASLGAANIAVRDMLNGTAFWLATERDDLAAVIYCNLVDGQSTLDTSLDIYEFVSTALGENEAQFLSLLFTSSVLAAMIFETGIFDSSVQPEENCDFCTE